MDNQNNPNLPNNPTPNPYGAPPTPFPDPANTSAFPSVPTSPQATDTQSIPSSIPSWPPTPQPAPTFDAGTNSNLPWPSDSTQQTSAPVSSNTWGIPPAVPSTADSSIPQTNTGLGAQAITPPFSDTPAPMDNWSSLGSSNPTPAPQSSSEPVQSQNPTNWTPPVPTPPQPEISNPASTTESSFTPFPDFNPNSNNTLSSFPSTPLSQPLDTQQTSPTPSWSPTSQPASTEATPTFTTPQTALPSTSTELSNNTEPKPALSPLDNPWGSPTQPPAIDGSASTIQPSWMNISQNPSTTATPNTSEPQPSESAPTDLSHLISNNSQPAQPTSETLVVPSTNPAPEVPSLPVEGHKGIPKWLFGLGAGLLILVLAASGYFILGVGQPTKTTTSLPATIATPANGTQQAMPVTQPTSQPVAQSTESPVVGSANFGELQGTGAPAATSTVDLLRQRQQGR